MTKMNDHPRSVYHEFNSSIKAAKAAIALGSPVDAKSDILAAIEAYYIMKRQKCSLGEEAHSDEILDGAKRTVDGLGDRLEKMGVSL
jgi:hypothetical protein